MDKLHENWGAGDVYQHYMGRWSAKVAPHFVEWLDLPPHKVWLDMGCGTGVLSRTILTHGQPQRVIGLDPSENFIRYAHHQTQGASFLVADGAKLPLASQYFDAIVSGLVLNFIPNPEQAVAAMVRVVKSGGTVAAYVWDYAGKMEFLRYFWDAAVELDPAAVTRHQGHRFPICGREPLSQLWHTAGFENVRVEPITISTHFDSFASYWEPFTVGHFPAPQYLRSLSPTQQENLHNYLQSIVPYAEDGSIQLKAQVWAVRGERRAEP